jgi:hypothetical protein
MTPPNLIVSLQAQGRTFAGPAGEVWISAEGVEIRVAFEGEMPVLPIGGTIATSLSADQGSKATTEAEARLSYQGRHGDRIECALLFSMQRMTRILGLLNLRQSVRVRPGAQAPVLVRLPGDPPVEVHDISTSGLSLLVSEDVQERLEGWTLHMRIRLPEAEDDLELVGQVMHRKLKGAAILYGIRFDPELTRGLSQIEDALHGYVMSRQNDLMRERAQRRSN